MFDPNNKIKKYDTVKDILKEFCDVRYGLYEVRKEGILKNMEEELLYLKNKIKFIGEIINNTISLKERDDDSLIEELKTKKYSLKEGTYEYLLTIQVRSMTSKRLEELKNKKINLEKDIEEYRNKTIKSIWKEELTELLKEYNKWLSFENERKVSKKDKKIKIKSKVNNK
jgi:DNA topoisomerase-2